jgi:hypothetical protein
MLELGGGFGFLDETALALPLQPPLELLLRVLLLERDVILKSESVRKWKDE